MSMGEGEVSEVLDLAVHALIEREHKAASLHAACRSHRGDLHWSQTLVHDAADVLLHAVRNAQEVDRLVAERDRALRRASHGGP